MDDAWNQEEEEEKAMEIDDDTLYGNTPQNDHENESNDGNDGIYDFSVGNDVIARSALMVPM